MAMVEEKGPERGKEDYTEDGTVDLKGRPVLRSKTGRWRACSFIVGYEVFERMAYHGIASNLVVYYYLTKKLHEGTVTSSNNVSNWVGSVMMPLLGACIADAYLGRYWTFVTASCIYLLRKRLSVARENHLLGQHDTLPLTIFILLPQFALSGIADSFVDVAKIEFFYDQAPEGMKSLGTSYFTTSLGLGCFLSSFLLSAVADITDRYGHKGWILDNLNISRLDYYYAFMAVLSFLNFLSFLVVAKFFVYNVDVTQNRSNVKS